MDTQASAPSANAGAPVLDRAEALKASPRIPIGNKDTRIEGSISLLGARVDDLHLKCYGEAPPNPKLKLPRCHSDGIAAASPRIVLLSPRGAKGGYYAEFGWTAGGGTAVDLPGSETLWSVENGARLEPGRPVTLRWDNPQGTTFRLTYAVDDNYMLTVTHEVANRGAAPVALAPYGRVVRQAFPTGQTFAVQHEGFLGYLAGDLRERTWKKIAKDGGASWVSTAGWLGLTDKYWMTALAPPQDAEFTGRNDTEATGGLGGTSARFELKAQQILPSASLKTVSHFFAGAKEVGVVDRYTKDLGIKKFDLAIDWGTFLWVLTKPMFHLLDFLQRFLNQYVGVWSFGIAILLVTVCVKLLMFPLTNRSFVMMGKMKKLAPMQKELQERFKDDKVELQKQTMALFQKEKVNPLAGCLPMFVQIPVFFSLYKVIFTTIEMRHAPFVGWIQDLSSRDPTSLLNLFGLLPFDASAITHISLVGPLLATFSIGIWPIIMGLTMALQTSLNPPPSDPTQKIVFGLMPVIFTIMLGSFPAGLVIYWTWNNLLSITQQYVILKRMGTPLDLSNAFGIKSFIQKLGGLKAPAAEPPAAKGEKSGA
ncbi:MAG: membrane protein insertase YidC [Alphaproteobacteria bacterium]